MYEMPEFQSAATFTLEALADVFTRSFEGYFYFTIATARDMAFRVRTEQLDLFHSVVMLVDGVPAGQALLGVRGDRAWCGGFGVCAPFRGRGLSHLLVHEVVRRARETGARTLALEVLARNERAIRAYTQAGFTRQRDLVILEWQGQARPAARPSPGFASAISPSLAERFAALRPRPAAWQRELPGLLVRPGMQVLAWPEHGPTRAYVLFREGGDSTVRLIDIGAERADLLPPLLAALQARAEHLTLVNEPGDSPFVPVLMAAGFYLADRQHDMVLDLAPVA